MVHCAACTHASIGWGAVCATLSPTTSQPTFPAHQADVLVPICQGKLRTHTTHALVTHSGPGGPARVYLTSSFIDSNRPVPVPVNYIEALDPATGQVVSFCCLL